MASGTIAKFMQGNDTEWEEITNPTVFIGTIKYRTVGEIAEVRNHSWIKLANELAAGSSVLLAEFSDFSLTIPGFAYVSSPRALIPAFIESQRLRIYNTTGAAITTSANLMIQCIRLL